MPGNPPPIDVLLIDDVEPGKAAWRADERIGHRRTVADAQEVRDTDFTGHFAGLYVRSVEANFNLDTGDVQADDGVNVIHDAAGNHFVREPAGISGPLTSTVNALARFADTLGAEIKNSIVTLDDSGNMAGVASVTGLAAPSNAQDAANKAYVDALIAAQDAMVFKGVIDCSANPNYPAADRGWRYVISVAGKIGGASGPNVEVGDGLLCLTDGTASGTHAAVGAQWAIIQANIDGAVIGPTSVTDDLPAIFDGTTGKLIKSKTYAAFKTLLALVKGDVGLGSVDNTSDAGKPVSTAQQTALDLKSNLASPTFAGTPAAPTAAPGTNTTQLSTTAFVKAAIDVVLGGVAGAFDTLSEIATALGLRASTTQVFDWNVFIETVADQDYDIVINSSFACTINEISTDALSGTCTLTGKINTTALGGTANSVSTTETTQAHASANALAAGDNFRLTISANAACADMQVKIKYTRTLA